MIGYGLSAPGASMLGVRRRTHWVVEDSAGGRVTLYAPDDSLCWGDLGAPVVDARGRVVALIDRVPVTCRPGTRATARLLTGAIDFLTAESNVAP